MRVLLSAYACRPNEGSERGLGWGWATTLAGLGHDVHVISRSRNRAWVERELALRPISGLRFTWVELPEWVLRLVHRGSGGKRIYYSLWQLAAYRAAKKLLAKGDFDVIHHVTFAKYWSLSPLAFLPRPFIWGPVGGGEDAPLRHWPHLGRQGIIFEMARAIARRLSEMNPFLRLAARRAALAVATTPETAARMRVLGARRIVLMSQVALAPCEIAQLGRLDRPPPSPWRLALVGGLVPLKAPHLVIGALAQLRDLDWRLEIFGAGPWLEHTRQLAVRKGVADRVVFHGHLPRRFVLTEMGKCHALIFAGLHDSGGMGCAEAMAAGLPVVALALGGPKVVVAGAAGMLVDASDPKMAMDGMARALRGLMSAPENLPVLSAAARAHAAEAFPWPKRAAKLYSLIPGCGGDGAINTFHDVVHAPGHGCGNASDEAPR